MAFGAQEARRTRTVIVIAAVAVVAVIALVAVVGFATPGTQPADDATAQATDAAATDAAGSSEDAAAAMDEIDAQYGTAAATLQSQYEADPSNPSALLNLANAYFDWGVAAQGHAADDADTAHARELLGDAIGYYDTYLQDNPDAKAAVVDRAICIFYTGDTERAIAELQALTASSADFAPAWANLGMFYEAAGRTDEAVSAYEQALEAAGDADAFNVKTYAQERLDALRGA